MRKYLFNIEAESQDDAVRKICKDEESANIMIKGANGVRTARKRKYSVDNPQFMHGFEFSDWFKDLMRKHFSVEKHDNTHYDFLSIFPAESKDKDFKNNGLRKVAVKAKADTGKWTQLLESQDFVLVEENKMKDLTTFLYESMDIVY